MLLTASLDGTVCCWELSSGKVRQQIETHSESVMDCDWFDEQTFASCSQDKSVHRSLTSSSIVCTADGDMMDSLLHPPLESHPSLPRAQGRGQRLPL
jgi:WD40 repeat protein